MNREKFSKVAVEWERRAIVSGARSPALARIMADRERAALRLAAVAGVRGVELAEEVTRREILFTGFRQTHRGGAKDATVAALESVTHDVMMGWL
jgi:hypothetical protein